MWRVGVGVAERGPLGDTAALRGMSPRFWVQPNVAAGSGSKWRCQDSDGVAARCCGRAAEQRGGRRWRRRVVAQCIGRGAPGGARFRVSPPRSPRAWARVPGRRRTALLRDPGAWGRGEGVAWVSQTWATPAGAGGWGGQLRMGAARRQGEGDFRSIHAQLVRLLGSVPRGASGAAAGGGRARLSPAQAGREGTGGPPDRPAQPAPAPPRTASPRAPRPGRCPSAACSSGWSGQRSGWHSAGRM